MCIHSTYIVYEIPSCRTFMHLNIKHVNNKPKNHKTNTWTMHGILYYSPYRRYNAVRTFRTAASPNRFPYKLSTSCARDLTSKVPLHSRFTLWHTFNQLPRVINPTITLPCIHVSYVRKLTARVLRRKIMPTNFPK